MSAITIGYFQSKEARFMSNIVITGNFLCALSHYAEIITAIVSANSYFQNFRSIHNPRLDYLIVDIKEFGLQQFLLREKHKVNLPFIVILHTVFSWAEKLVYMIPLIKNEDIIIAPSEFAKKIFLKIASNINVNFIPYCLDIEEIKKARNYRDKHQGKNIVYMGRLVQEKGAGEIVECLPEIKKTIGNVRLNIIGPKNHFMKKIENRIKTLDLTKRISFLGLKTGKEKYRLLSQNDIFVFPTTLKEENAPVSLLEALACGLPVITTDWAANKEIIRNGDNGFLLPVSYEKTGEFKIEKRTLSSLVIMILKDKKLRLRLRKSALMTAKKYDYKKVIPMFLKVLKKRKEKIEFYDWKVLKNKKAVDFKDLFERDFLFFMCYDKYTFSKTYGSLLIKMKKTCNHGGVQRKKVLKKRIKSNVLISSQIINKIRRDFVFFLLKS